MTIMSKIYIPKLHLCIHRSTELIEKKCMHKTIPHTYMDLNSFGKISTNVWVYPLASTKNISAPFVGKINMYVS